MISIIRVPSAGYACNSYILTADGKTAVAVDAGDESIAEFLDRRALVCKYVLLTHGHLDHIAGCGALYARGAQICCGEREKDFIFSRENYGIFNLPLPDFGISRTFCDGEKFSLCGVDFTAVSTPGHTVGGTSYICGNNLFTGDTLFCGSVGRTDFPGGDFNTLISSLKKLFALEGDYAVYSGHGEQTTMQAERLTNPFASYIR